MNPDDLLSFPLGVNTVQFPAFAHVYNRVIFSAYVSTIQTLSGPVHVMDSSPLYAMFIPATGRTRR